jgi:ribonuclease HI
MSHQLPLINDGGTLHALPNRPLLPSGVLVAAHVMVMDEEERSSYTVATDGACRKNPGPTGWAWVGEDGRWAAGSVREGTNNVGELLAVLFAVRDHLNVADLTIVADSRYAIDTYTRWMDGHRARGWRTAAGEPTKNIDILQALIEIRDERRARGMPDVTFVHVRGHQGHRLNGWADERAVRASHHAADGLELVWSSAQGRDLVDVTVDSPSMVKEKARKKRQPRQART